MVGFVAALVQFALLCIERNSLYYRRKKIEADKRGR